MKRVFLVVIVAGVLVAGSIIYFTAHAASRYLTRSDETKRLPPVTCHDQHQSHVVTIQNNKVTPGHTEASVCDTLTVTNMDDKLREIALGQHLRHHEYDGAAERTLQKDQSFTLELNQRGIFTFHDHLQAEVKGGFTVTNKQEAGIVEAE